MTSITKSDIFCAHVAHLASLKTYNKFSRLDVKKAFTEIEMSEDQDEQEMHETDKICQLQKIYRSLLPVINDHDTLLQVVLKNSGDLDMELGFDPIDEALTRTKGAPVKAQGINLGVAGGDGKDDDIDITTEQSDVSIRSNRHVAHKELKADSDFEFFEKILNAPESAWQREIKTMNLKIFRKKDFKGASLYMVKCVVNLPGIPKEVAFNAVADIYTRRKWDAIVKHATVLEEDKKNESFVFRYALSTPSFLTQREAVVRSKIKKDFPYPGMWSLHNSSVQHTSYPENPQKFVRVDLKISGFVFEDAPEIKGCKMRWVIQNDMKGNVPKAWVNQRALKNPQTMMESLYAACQKIMKGGL